MNLNRREFLVHAHATGLAAVTAGSTSLMSISGCTKSKQASSSPGDTFIFGKLGLSDGRFQKPRAIAIDQNQSLYVVDKTGRIQVFDTNGTFLRSWTTPEIANGKPTGLSIANDGSVMVADTHYFRILFYTPNGEPLHDRQLGGSFGPAPGQMAFVTDCVQTIDNDYYVSEYGAFDRIQKYSSKGEFLGWFGEHGDAPKQFSRPQSLALDENGWLWIADSCNHRIQVYDWTGDEPRFVKGFGSNGTSPGQFRYPYGIWLEKIASTWPSLRATESRS